MGCFLACFGISKKRKRRKHSNKVEAGDQRHGSYVPLDSSISINLDSTENPINSDSELSNKSKERSSSKITKRVRFNLNVQTYEPIPTDYQFLESDEDEEKDNNGSLLPFLSEEVSTAYPSNYRYQNCRDSYDDEEEISFEESDLDDDADDNGEDEDGNCDVHYQNTSQEKFSGEYCSVSSIESQKIVSLPESAEVNADDLMAIRASTDTELKSLGLNGNTRYRSQYVQSVLNPVENLTQWKAVKSRAAPAKQWRKESAAFKQEAPMPLSSKPPNQETAVNASLSNWLFSPNSFLSETTTINSSSTVAVDKMSSKEIMLHRSTSWRNKENREIIQLQTC